ncbi:Stage V sporulation protein B [Lachnospiraceae bacterium TWA4]|nr:Stage V sporulation protein B [Lachnospiraceae bacterium TWA4]
MGSTDRKEKESNFIVQGGILALASVLVRIIGLIYRIPMNNILDTGIAVYSTAYSIYSLIWMIASFGVPTAVSRMVAQRIGQKRYKNVDRVFRTAILFSIVVGGLAAGVLFFGANFFANVVFRMPEIKYALMILAPTVWISTFIGAFRGFYQGLGTMIPTAISQIAEQIVNAVMSIVGSYVLWNYGHKLDLEKGGKFYSDAYGAAGGTIGTASGAVVALLVCIVIYVSSRPQLKKMASRDKSKRESTSRIMKILILTMLPITLNSATYNISSILDNSIFGNYMDAVRSHDLYLSMWAAYEGKYHLITHVPLAFATALSASAVPNLSKVIASQADSKVVEGKIHLALRFSMLIAIPSCIGLFALADPVMSLLFAGTPKTNPLAATLVQMGCITVLMYSFSTITNGILQGIGKVSTPAKNALVALVGHIIVLAVCLWIFKLDVYGVVISDIVFGLFMNILNYYSIRKEMTSFHLEIRKTFFLPFVSAVIMGGFTLVAYDACHFLCHSNAISTVFAIAVAVAVYAVALIKTHAMEEEDLRNFPKGRVLVRIAKKAHLL